MSLPKELGDREYQKFVEDEDGNVSLRIGPGVKDSSGSDLVIEDGAARTFDRQMMTELKSITQELQKVVFQLEIITGVNFGE